MKFWAFPRPRAKPKSRRRSARSPRSITPIPHGGDDAKKKFQEICAAYDIVGDKEKRAKFDRGEIDESGNPRGFDPARAAFDGDPFGGGGGGGAARIPFHLDSAATARRREGFRAEDIFSDLFGGSAAGARAAQPRKGEDFAFAHHRELRGSRARRHAPHRAARRARSSMCRFRSGLKDGQQIRLQGPRRRRARNGGPPGDVLLTVSVAPHPYLTRDGDNLRMDLPVTLQEAVLGGNVPVPTLTGTVALNVPANSNSGTTLRLKGKGIPGRGTAGGGEPAGDLYVKLVVTLPDKPDADLKKFAEGWGASYDPRAKLK